MLTITKSKNVEQQQNIGPQILIKWLYDMPVFLFFESKCILLKSSDFHELTKLTR